MNEADGAVKWTVNLDMPSLSCVASLRRQRLLVRLSWVAIMSRQRSADGTGPDDLAAAYFQATGSTEIDRLSDVDTTPVVLTALFSRWPIMVT